MPSLLLEVQLECLGRIWKRADRADGARFITIAEEMRATRLRALAVEAYDQCERLCRRAARGLRERRGAGQLIAAAVADRGSGLGAYDEALMQWFIESAPGDADWSSACAQAHAVARERLSRANGAHP